MDALLAQANGRIKAGEPESVVEAWLTQTLQAQGFLIQQPPPAWDAFARARWQGGNQAFADSRRANAAFPKIAAPKAAASLEVTHAAARETTKPTSAPPPAN